MAQHGTHYVCLNVARVTMQRCSSAVRMVTSSIHFATVCVLCRQRGQVVMKYACGTHILSEVLYAGGKHSRFMQAISHPKPPFGDRDDSSPSSICRYLLVYC